jgi:hypothetical protein
MEQRVRMDSDAPRDEVMRERIECACGWKGRFAELVTDPTSDDTDDIRCPQCDNKYSWSFR